MEETEDANYGSAAGGRDEQDGVSLSPGKGPLVLPESAQTGCDRLAGFIPFPNFLRFAV